MSYKLKPLLNYVFFVRIAGDSDFVSSKNSFLYLSGECMLIINYGPAHRLTSGTQAASCSDKNVNSVNVVCHAYSTLV